MHLPDDSQSTPPELGEIRAEIDRLDLTLVDFLPRRAALARHRDHRREAGLVRRAAEAESRPHPDSRESVGGRDG